ncbi:tRNA 2-thiouridine(34) synthase MnmA [Pseudoflavonifractor sp. MSJ-37]|uniref:tRNA 2-thiouridine(34) synthase MnmA n=1 Tax=Pseudoflavonifractor sp. MSJ-37 TaxID=2841531 RepID=UPI001C121549|nr:tRNA 2-thiouridine(34) synthase MnmA [Pseudoflavonifractor sp. MSJ-37]MBU5434916.1 tRNA 2-thiouridine(34) synthase MnmA [Pseudoflavonifractor sp. MSJ-37]
MKKRVLIAMSGGVDSSVAAYLLQQQGYECMGVTMRLYENTDVGIPKGHTCCSLDDVEDARSVAARLGIPYYVLDFSQEFRSAVMDKFVRTYEAGGTPNPCIDCNRYLKFGLLLQRARELGCDFIATGHYAVIGRREDGRWLLRAGEEDARDQSYVLYSMTQEELAHTLFPLGELPKAKVRAIAEEQGFCNARKHDSQDICFVPDGDYMSFLERWNGKPYPHGDLIDQEGKVLGRHRGAAAYTIGQRRGLGLAMPHPVYVCGKDMAANTVTVGPSSALFSPALLADDWNWIVPPPEDGILRGEARVRYHQAVQSASVTRLEDGQVRLDFDAPQRGISPGQAVVLYQGDLVLGGGTILRALPEHDG